MRPEKDFSQRIFLYNALLTESFKLPVYSVAIYLERGKYKTFPEEYKINLDGDLENSFRFGVIRLWEHKKEIEEGMFLEFAPLLSLVEDVPDENTLRKEKELISRIGDRDRRLDLLSVAVTVASRKFSKKFLINFFKEELVMLKETSIVEDWVQEGIEQGTERGIKQGVREDIKELLEAKLGEIDKEMDELLERIDDLKLLRIVFRNAIRAENLNEIKSLVKKLVA